MKTCPKCGENEYDETKYKICYKCYANENPKEGYVLCSICGKNYHDRKWEKCYDCMVEFRI